MAQNFPYCKGEFSSHQNFRNNIRGYKGIVIVIEDTINITNAQFFMDQCQKN